MNKKKKRKREGVVLIRVTSPASQTASVLSFQHVKRTKMGILPVCLAPQQSMTTLAFTGLVVIVRWNIHIVVSVSNVLLPYFIRKTDYMRARIIKHPEIYNTSWITPSCPNFPKQRPIHSVRNNKLHISKMQMPSSESVLRACREQQMRLPSYNRWFHQRGRWDMIAQRPRI